MRGGSYEKAEFSYRCGNTYDSKCNIKNTRAVFKIPLTYILNEDGMAVFNIAFEVYIMFLSFIISGLPFAISKMVAESNSRGEYSKTHRIVKISTILLVCIGIVGSVALYFGSPFFALAMKEEKAIYAIK